MVLILAHSQAQSVILLELLPNLNSDFPYVKYEKPAGIVSKEVLSLQHSVIIL